MNDHLTCDHELKKIKPEETKDNTEKSDLEISEKTKIQQTKK